MNCPKAKHASSAYFLKHKMNSALREKYGQRQQIGNQIEDKAIPLSPKVREQSEFQVVRATAMKLCELKEEKEDCWDKVPEQYRRRKRLAPSETLYSEPVTQEFEMNAQLQEKAVMPRRTSKRLNIKETKKRAYKIATKNISPHSARGTYKCNWCGMPNKADHVCAFKVIGFKRVDCPPADLRSFRAFYKCGRCNDYKDDHLCVPIRERRSVDELILAHRYYEQCEHFPVRRREINNKVWEPGEMAARIASHPKKRTHFDVEPHGYVLDPLTESIVGEAPTIGEVDSVPPVTEVSFEPTSRAWMLEKNKVMDKVHGAIKHMPLSDPGVCSVVSQLENFVLYAYSVYEATSFSHVFAITLMYIKTCTQESICSHIEKFLMEAVPSNSQQPVVEPHASYTFKDMWHMLKSNTIFPQIMTLLTAAISVSSCAIKKVEWNPFGFEVLRVEASNRATKAVDVVDACVELFSWFCETGYQVIQQRSLVPILFSDQKVKEFNEKCDYIFGHQSQIVAGNFEASTIEDFEMKLDDCLVEVNKMRSLKTTGVTPSWLTKRFVDLMEVKNKIVAHHKSSTIRFFPCSFAITGETGVGKTLAAKATMKTALAAMGFDTDVKRQRTRNWDQKHDNEIVSNVLGIYYDDVGAAKAQFVERSEAAAFIHENNGVPLCADKAELESKGVTFFQHKVSVVTSNFVDLNFPHYSDYPAAALNRLWFARFSVKPEYCDGNGVSLNKDHPDVINAGPTSDLWNITVEKVFVSVSPAGKSSFFFSPVKGTFGGEYYDTTQMNMTQYLRFVAAIARNHKMQQERVMVKAKEIDELPMCKKCSLFQSICTCPEFVPNDTEPHSDFGIVPGAASFVSDSLWQVARNYVYSYIDPVWYLKYVFAYQPLRTRATSWLVSQLTASWQDRVTLFVMSLVPDSVENSNLFRTLLDGWQKSAALRDNRQLLTYCCCWVLFWCWVSFEHARGYFISWNHWYTIWMCLWALVIYSHIFQRRLAELRYEYFKRRDALTTYAASQQQVSSVEIGLGVCVLVLGIKVLMEWNAQRFAVVSAGHNSTYDPQAAVAPATDVLIKKPDISQTEIQNQKAWYGSMMERIGMKITTDPSAKTMATGDMVSAFERNNLFHALVTTPSGDTMRCNIFFPCKGVALVPSHIFHVANDLSKPRMSGALLFKVHRSDKPGGVFEFKADDSTTVHDDVLDCAAIHVPNCPDLKDRLKWLPQSHASGSSLATFLVRTADGMRSESVTVKFEKTGHKYRPNLPGGSYTTTLAKSGACMGLLIAESKEPCILGVHIGGIATRDYGVMQTIRVCDVEKWQTQLRGKGCLAFAQPSELPSEQYGKSVLSSTEVHPHSIFASMDSTHSVEILGSTKLRTKQKTTVAPSILSDHVTDVCGVPRKWAGPKLEPNWKAYNATIEHAVNPIKPFDPALLHKAKEDWISPLRSLAQDDVAFKPLSDSQAIMGVPGVRFLDPLPMSTSMGFPLFGKKSKYFEDVVENGVLINRIPSLEIQNETQRMLACWRAGERAYPVTSATLKDEPTAMVLNEHGEWVLPDKVRVFQCSAVAMSLCIRKYFLPVARFLAENPLVTECAVGLNCMSDQWERLMDFAEHFADDDQVLAFDYSKYDVRMSSQLTHAAWSIYIELARMTGRYSDDDLHIMTMMLADIVHPIIDWNGTLIKLYSINTSGHNLTVNVNSTVNSLLVRMAFFTLFPESENFRSFVALTTYGDDAYGSVHQDFRKLSFRSYRDFLAAHDMKITLPSKTDEVREFLYSWEADFLKRNSVYIPEIGCKLGALDEDSIFKSLHANLKSKSETPRQVAVSCMEGAMHEWFAHGREVYEKRRQQMEEVCLRAHLTIPSVKVSFDERVAHWKQQYNKM
nr:MAG: nonstructural polyprotein [Salisharnavirus sp.]